MKTTTIRISREFQQELVKLGKKGESYEEIIKRLINDGQLNAGLAKTGANNNKR